MGERRIISCHSETATFHHSHCKYRNDVEGSIRKFTAWCREPTPPGAPRPTFTLPSEARAMAASLTTEDTSLFAELGMCDEDEVCIDSLYSVNYREGMALIANCVKKKLFIDAGLWKDEWNDDEDGAAEREEEQLEEGELRPGKSSMLGSGLDVIEEHSGEQDPDLSLCKTQKQTSNGAAENPSCVQLQQPPPGLKNPPSLFAGKYASIVFSKDENGDTPLKVEELGLRSLANTTESSTGGKTGSGSAAENGSRPTTPGVAQQKRICTNCMKLKTYKPFTMDTKALEMEVKTVGAGTAALAGVLWVALLSG